MNSHGAAQPMKRKAARCGAAIAVAAVAVITAGACNSSSNTAGTTTTSGGGGATTAPAAKAPTATLVAGIPAAGVWKNPNGGGNDSSCIEPIIVDDPNDPALATTTTFLSGTGSCEPKEVSWQFVTSITTADGKVTLTMQLGKGPTQRSATCVGTLATDTGPAAGMTGAVAIPDITCTGDGGFKVNPGGRFQEQTIVVEGPCLTVDTLIQHSKSNGSTTSLLPSDTFTFTADGTPAGQCK